MPSGRDRGEIPSASTRPTDFFEGNKMGRPATHLSASDQGCECLTCSLIRSERTDYLRDQIKPNRQQRRKLAAENQAWPLALKQVPKSEWPDSQLPPEKWPNEVWRSRDYLCCIYYRENGVERLSINRTSHNGERFDDNITWDDLQRLKSECGRGDRDAVEIYPADGDVVNVANLRHLFVLPEPFPLTWRKSAP